MQLFRFCITDHGPAEQYRDDRLREYNSPVDNVFATHRDLPQYEMSNINKQADQYLRKFTRFFCCRTPCIGNATKQFMITEYNVEHHDDLYIKYKCVIDKVERIGSAVVEKLDAQHDN